MVEGVIGGSALYDALVALGRSVQTGILTVQGEDEIIAFSLSKGEVVSADALNQTLEEGLGEVIVEGNLVSAEDFAGLAAEYQAGGGRVIDLLVERSFLSRAQLLGALREHTYRLCLEALTWQEGEFRFYQGEEVAFEEGFQAIGIDELCVRATQDLGSGGPLKGDVPSHGAILQRVGTFFADSGAGSREGEESLLEDTDGRFVVEARKVFDCIDGERTLAQAAEDAGVPVYTAQHLVCGWVREGILETRVLAVPPAVVEAPAVVEPQVDLALGYEALEPVLDLSESDGALETEVPVETPRTQPAPSKREVFPWPSRLMGLGLCAAMVFLLISQPSRILFPFPWQGSLREAYQKERRVLIHYKIDQAATTFFLLNGRYPDELADLHTAGLLAAQDLVDPSGRSLSLSAGAASFVVEVENEDEDEAIGSLTSTITGNFLLDPEYAGTPEVSLEPPLVLLD